MEKYGNKNNNNYIVDVIRSKDKKILIVVFADGGMLSVENNERNFSKLVKKMEEQKQEGLKRKGKYITQSIASVMASLGGFGISTGLISMIPEQMNSQAAEQIATSIILVGGSFVTAICLMESSKNLKRVIELSKFEYAKKHKKTLNQIKNYQYSLEDLSNDKKRHFTIIKNPTAAIYTDYYTEWDLRRIVSNIEKKSFLYELGIDEYYIGEGTSKEDTTALLGETSYPPYMQTDPNSIFVVNESPKIFTKTNK